MHRIDGPSKALAALLAALAGYVDAMGFLALGGFFVSFMSGNSTRLGAGLAARSPEAAVAGSLVALFVAGVVIGTLIGRWAPHARRTLVLTFVAALLALAAWLGRGGSTWIAVTPLAVAMGAENAVFERDGDVIGVTYMTGALVKLGQRLAAALLGGDRWAWAPYLLLWMGLVGGALLGALSHAAFGLQGLWAAALVAAGAAAIAARSGYRGS